ncbi:MAG: molybdopterin oxidoreductase family protein [Fibrella sp.]|nr:molybdopterin oxidoreductase family protein [Armatimonadota bacterium]
MIATHCPYCALQCGMHLASEAQGTMSVQPRDFPTNRGGLCRKGWTATDLLMHPERLTSPLMRSRRNAPLIPVSWDVALDRIAHEVRNAQTKAGSPDGVAVFGGGGLTNEKVYLLGKFARIALRTSQIDYNGRFCMATAAAAGNRAFGIDRGLPFPIEDVANAQAILLVGANPAETMPPIMQHFDAMKASGGALIVADPRRTATAEAAQLHLQLTPGTDSALANGLLHIAAESGYLDHNYIAERTVGYDAVRRAVAAYWPDRVERITGVPVKQLREAARLLGEAKNALCLTARGPEQQSKGVENTLAFINLMLALGAPGKSGSGWGCLTGQGNGQGGREHGQKADQLPGYRSILNPADREHIANVWGISPDELPQAGVSAYELLDSLGRDAGPKALFVFGSNLVVSAPHSSHIEERLAALDFLCVSDIFLSETAARADVVLPTAQWAEEDGTMTNLEGRVIRRRRAAVPPPGVQTDAEAMCAIAERLGRGQYFPTAEPEEIFTEFRRATAGGVADYNGITYARIESENGVFWPCPDESHPGTPRLFAKSFPTPDGRAKFHPVQYRPSAEEPDDEYPLYLTTGRVMAQYQSGTQTRRVKDLNDTAPEGFVEVHPHLAKHFGIADGDMIRVTTRRGTASVRTRLTRSIREDTLFIPFHYAGRGRANLLTNPALDPVSRMPEFKVCAARLEPFLASEGTI